jgi:nucleotide-binding universal stress UspA family protein
MDPMTRINRILVGIDFSSEAELALAHALQLARRTGASLTLTHVVPLPADLTADSSYDPLFRATALAGELVARQKEDASSMLAEVAAYCRSSGVECEVLLMDDTPSGGLARGAAEAHVDLVVVGSHGRTGVRRLLLGSVAERTTRLTDRSTLVARGAATAEDGYQRILVACDFSPYTDVAIRAALTLAADGARIEVVHCWQTPVMPAGMPVATMRDDLEHDVAQAGARLLASYQGRAPGAHLAFVPLEGAPAEALRARAEETGSELIVVGSHGRRGVKRWLLGSVAEAIVRHAPCSVLVAHQDTAAAADIAA